MGFLKFPCRTMNVFLFLKKCAENFSDINYSPVLVIVFTEVLDRTKNCSFKKSPYSLFNQDFEEKEIEFLKGRFCQKLLSNDDNNWAIEL